MQRGLWLTLAASSAALSACGSKATTAGAPSTPAASAPAQTAPQTTSTGTHTSPGCASSSGGTQASTTRTATEPAFTNQPAAGEAQTAAEATVRAHGFTPVNPSDYHPSQTLRVLIGTRGGSSGAYSHSAFFFIDGRFIGTDASDASGTLSVVSQGDTEVTLAYPLYSSRDSVCCPSGGQTHVRFQLNNGKLVALDPIPPTRSSTGVSRR
jgi:hypothetical protein